MTDDDEWSLDTVWQESYFPFSEDLEALNEVTPDEIKYVRNRFGEYDEYTSVELHRKV